jgi:hypothetical protein
MRLAFSAHIQFCDKKTSALASSNQPSHARKLPSLHRLSGTLFIVQDACQINVFSLEIHHILNIHFSVQKAALIHCQWRSVFNQE